MLLVKHLEQLTIPKKYLYVLKSYLNPNFITHMRKNVSTNICTRIRIDTAWRQMLPICYKMRVMNEQLTWIVVITPKITAVEFRIV